MSSHCPHHPSMFHHSAENNRAITSENRAGHLLRKDGMDRWRRRKKRLSYIYYGEAYYKGEVIIFIWRVERERGGYS